jgi:hypothetical protein
VEQVRGTAIRASALQMATVVPVRPDYRPPGKDLLRDMVQEFTLLFRLERRQYNMLALSFSPQWTLNTIRKTELL